MLGCKIKVSIIKQLFCCLLVMGLAACGGGGSNDAVAETPTSPAPAPAPAPAAAAKWTYMVYIAADNNLANAAEKDIQELLAANSSADVNVVVQVEQSGAYAPSGTAATNAIRGAIRNGRWDNQQSLGANAALNFADPATLTSFINWSKTNYPAERYGLVLWSHGGGWKMNKVSREASKGILDDSSSGALMSMAGVAKAISDSNTVLELLNFDACLMGMYEVAYELRNVARYVVASEESIPGAGDPYTAVVNRLTANPTQTAAEFAKGIAADFHAYYQSVGRDTVTISAYDMSKLTGLHTAMQALAGHMVANMATLRAPVETVLGSTSTVPAYDYPANRDVVAFSKAMRAAVTTDATLTTLLTAVEAAAADLVIENKVYSPSATHATLGSTGIAVYLPLKSQTSNAELTAYRALAVNGSATLASGAGTWASLVDWMATNGTGTQYTSTTGGFAWYIEWDNPGADVDLLVNEPNGLWAGSSYALSSANAFSSADSVSSGQRLESYTTNQTISNGSYDVFVQLYSCKTGNTNCADSTTNVNIYFKDIGATSFSLIRSQKMSLDTKLNFNLTTQYPGSQTYAEVTNAITTQGATDWYSVGRTTKSSAIDKSQSLLGLGKREQLRLKEQVTK